MQCKITAFSLQLTGVISFVSEQKREQTDKQNCETVRVPCLKFSSASRDSALETPFDQRLSSWPEDGEGFQMPHQLALPTSTQGPYLLITRTVFFLVSGWIGQPLLSYCTFRSHSSFSQQWSILLGASSTWSRPHEPRHGIISPITPFKKPVAANR